MVKPSKLKNAEQAQQYFKSDFANEQQRYFSEDHTVHGEWRGRLAQEWGLSGDVRSEQFARLTEGQHPNTGEQLVVNVAPHEYTDKNGETKMTSGHRPGWDLTFSAPKSVSAQAIYGADERIWEAHRKAVDTALKAVEEYAIARIGGDDGYEVTGKVLAVTFEHDASRPVDGIASPDVHTHAIVFNMTQMKDGRTRSLETLEMYRAQQIVGSSVYRSELACNLREIGYQTERGKYGEPEIVGYSRDFINEVSLRTAEIRDREKETGYDSAQARNLYALETRASKRTIDEHKTEEFIGQAARKHGIDFERLKEQAMERGSLLETERQQRQVLRDSLDYARDHNQERSASFREDRLIADALDKGQGTIRRDDVLREIERREHAGEIVNRREARVSRVLTTSSEIAKEEQNIRIMQRGQGCCEPLARDPDKALQAASVSPELAGKSVKLNEGQERVFREVLANCDQVQAIQGDAGTGKTFTLRMIRLAAEEQGYTVRGFGTTGRNTKQLGESGIQVETLATHLQKGEKAHSTGERTLYVLDESSLASSKDVNKFLSQLQPNERVLLVGDAKQHQSVDAGKAFEQLQEAGMRTAHLDVIIRQKNEQLREVATDLAAGRRAEAFEKLLQQGYIHEIKDPKERLSAMVDQALKHRDQARELYPDDRDRQKLILLTPQNDRKREINQAVRERLQERGEIQREEETIGVLEKRGNVTKTQLKWAAKYEQGDIVKYTKDSPAAGIKKDDYARVLARNEHRNTIRVELLNGTRAGKQIEYNPERRSGCEVFRESERAFAVGDSVQFTAKWAKKGINNRDQGTVQALDKKGNVHVRMEDGRDVRFHKSEFRHLEHGYCVTSHVSQGQTAGFSGGDYPTQGKNLELIEARAFYVGETRAVDNGGWYTDDIEKLRACFTRSVSRETAVDAEKYRAPGREQSGPTKDIAAGPRREAIRAAPEQQLSEWEQFERELRAEIMKPPTPAPERSNGHRGEREVPTLQQLQREAAQAQQSLTEALGKDQPSAAASRVPGGHTLPVQRTGPELSVNNAPNGRSPSNPGQQKEAATAHQQAPTTGPKGKPKEQEQELDMGLSM